ncbi:MAG: NADH-quinone oxidoreductase subunit C [Fervidicoccaceae archaeon]
MGAVSLNRSEGSSVISTIPESLPETVRAILPSYPHLIGITAVHFGSNIELLYSFDNWKGETKHILLTLPEKGGKVESISSIVRGAYIYEMEVRDMFGVAFENHPIPHSRLLLPDSYPQTSPPPLLKTVTLEQLHEILDSVAKLEPPSPAIPITGSSRHSVESLVILPFGPYHPALKEPEHFAIALDGEKIVEARPRIGYVHRGIEKLAENRTFLQTLFLVERVCGICSFHHSWTYTLAVEKLLGITPDRRAEYLRTLVAELERIHSHALWTGLLGYWAGFDSMFMWLWSARERIMKLLEMIAGNRVNKSFITIGGVRYDVSEEKLKIVQREISEFEKEFRRISEAVMSYEPIAERTKNIGVYHSELAVASGAVGPVLRATGIPYDIRKVEPYGAYPELSFDVITEKRGDVLSIANVRVRETFESIRIIQQIVEKIPSGNPVPSMFFMGTSKEGEAFARTEPPRGELYYYVRGKAGMKNPYRVKIRTPTLPNLVLAAEALKGYTLADVPLILTMIDPCFSCEDRAIVYPGMKEPLMVMLPRAVPPNTNVGCPL